MNNIFKIVEFDHTMSLEKYSNPSFLKNLLDAKYKSENNSIIDKNETRADLIIKKTQKLIDIREPEHISNYDQLVIPHEKKTDFKEISNLASTFFQHALELYLTAFSMSNNTSPLIEYYSLLQCVKGRILLDFKVPDFILFSKHGISWKKKGEFDLKFQVKDIGVFQGLLILDKSLLLEELVKYLEKKYILTFQDLIEKKMKYKTNTGITSEQRVLEGDPISAFLVSFGLSCFVRYHPLTWKKILIGEETSINLAINNYRRDDLTEAFEEILKFYSPLRQSLT